MHVDTDTCYINVIPVLYAVQGGWASGTGPARPSHVATQRSVRNWPLRDDRILPSPATAEIRSVMVNVVKPSQAYVIVRPLKVKGVFTD